MKTVASKNKFLDFELYKHSYKMNGKNTLGITKILRVISLNYIPKANCYLKMNGIINDTTFNTR